MRGYEKQMPHMFICFADSVKHSVAFFMFLLTTCPQTDKNIVFVYEQGNCIQFTVEIIKILRQVYSYAQDDTLSWTLTSNELPIEQKQW